MKEIGVLFKLKKELVENEDNQMQLSILYLVL